MTTFLLMLALVLFLVAAYLNADPLRARLLSLGFAAVTLAMLLAGFTLPAFLRQ